MISVSGLQHHGRSMTPGRGCIVLGHTYCFRSRKVRQPSSSKVGDRLTDYFLDPPIRPPDWPRGMEAPDWSRGFHINLGSLRPALQECVWGVPAKIKEGSCGGMYTLFFIRITFQGLPSQGVILIFILLACALGVGRVVNLIFNDPYFYGEPYF